MFARTIVIISNKLLCYDFTKFLLIGGISFIIYYIVLWLFYDVIKIIYFFAIAYSCIASNLFHYSANKKFTFRGGDLDFKSNIIRYIVIAIVNLFLQIMIVTFSYKFIGLNFYLSNFIGIFFTIFFGYYFYKKWVFV